MVKLKPMPFCKRERLMLEYNDNSSKIMTSNEYSLTIYHDEPIHAEAAGRAARQVGWEPQIALSVPIAATYMHRNKENERRGALIVGHTDLGVSSDIPEFRIATLVDMARVLGYPVAHLVDPAQDNSDLEMGELGIRIPTAPYDDIARLTRNWLTNLVTVEHSQAQA
jgi:hypothetical protein